MSEVLVTILALALLVVLSFIYYLITGPLYNIFRGNRERKACIEKIEYLKSIGFQDKEMGDYKCLSRGQQIVPYNGIAYYSMDELKRKFY